VSTSSWASLVIAGVAACCGQHQHQSDLRHQLRQRDRIDRRRLDLQCRDDERLQPTGPQQAVGSSPLGLALNDSTNTVYALSQLGLGAMSIFGGSP
jgi:hypothetical protein